MTPLTNTKLVDAVLAFLGHGGFLTRQEVRAMLDREIESAGQEALLTLDARLTADTGWNYYPRDPLAQRIHHRLAGRFLDEGSEVRGVHHLRAVEGGPVVIVANHLSYSDANVIEVLLQRAGQVELANRLTALAGPKVFTSRERRFSSLCFGTIKVPQSTDVSSGEAVLSGRAVALAAKQAIAVARERLAAGDALLLFGEGTRSRTGEMHLMLSGVARYLDAPGTSVLPVGLTGSEALFPVDASTPRPARAVLHFGRPLRADALLARANGDRRVVMDAIGLAVAELLPTEYRGVYRSAGDFTEANEARQFCAR